MPNHLDLPPELAALIEKREQEDRRQQAAESAQAATPSTSEVEHRNAAPAVERRTGKDRRTDESS